MNLESKKQIAIIAIAISLGVVVSIMVGQYIKNDVKEQTQIIADQFAKENKATVERIQQQVAQEVGSLKAQQQALLSQQDQLKKQIASGVGPKGQALVKENVAPFSYRMPSGKRAVTINIDSLSAVGGLISPGDFIDIIAQLKVPQDSKQNSQNTDEITSIIFQNLQVLAVGANFNPSGDPLLYDAQQKSRALFVTLAVDPDEAGLLTFAQTKGKLQLSLRSPKEQNTATVEVASWQALSDFVLDKQGTELLLPRQKAAIESVPNASGGPSDAKPFIQIFKSGKESSL